MIETLNAYSGLLTALLIVLAAILWFWSEKYSQKTSAKDIQGFNLRHDADTKMIKDIAFRNQKSLEMQAIHQEYAKGMVKDSVEAIIKNNQLITALTAIMESIKDKLK